MYENNNPKARVGAKKIQMQLIPPAALVHLATALENGAEKYGPYNWREEPISIMVYMGAMQRHLAAYQDGEEVAADSGVHHIAHVMACCALLLDSMSSGLLQDDRPPPGAAPELIDSITEYRKDEQ